MNAVAVGVSWKRRGSLEEAQALATCMRAQGVPCAVFDTSSLKSVLRFFAQQVSQRPERCTRVFVWNIGGFALLFAALGRLTGSQVMHLKHEPGGFRRKIAKGDGQTYALFATFLEAAIDFFCVKLLCPSRSNAELFGLTYAPLLNLQRFLSFDQPPAQVLYLGRKDQRRCADIAEQLQRSLPSLGLSLKFFPADFSDDSEEGKRAALQGSFCVFNCYRSWINQSGVTSDAFSFGVPILVSDFDHLAPTIRQYGAGIVLGVEELQIDRIQSSLLQLHSKFLDFHQNSKALFAAELGEQLFARHWWPLLR